MNTSEAISSLSDDALTALALEATSWTALLRGIGIRSPKPRHHEAVKDACARLGLDVAHLEARGHGPAPKWSEEQLASAVRSSTSWKGTARALGGSRAAVQKRVTRLGIDVSHFVEPDPPRRLPPLKCPPRDDAALRVAAEQVAAAWYVLHGYEVSMPVSGSSRHDLLALRDGVCARIQVKSSTYRVAGGYQVTIGRSGRSNGWSGHPFSDEDADEVFVVTRELDLYRFPAALFTGRRSILLGPGCEPHRVTLVG